MNQKKTQLQSRLDGAAGGSGLRQRRERVDSMGRRAVDRESIRLGRLRGEALLGKRFHRLVIIGNDKPTVRGQRVVIVKCDCGTVKSCCFGLLKSGNTKSCGCYRKEVTSVRNSTHGFSRGGTQHRILRTYFCMMTRCYNSKSKSFGRYGAKGITVCDRWRFGENGQTGFECFVSDMGLPAGGYSIDRFPDTRGNYGPSNCRWATMIEQANNKTNNRILECNGRKQTLSQWAKERGMNVETIWARIVRLGWSEQDAILEPVQKYKS